MPVVYGYARASTEEQVDTLKLQESQILREYEYRYQPQGFTWGKVYIDAGVSGGKALANRPQGLALSLVLEPKDVVIITKLDRGFRSARNFLEQSERWRERGIHLRMMDLDVDTSTPVGQLLAGILSQVAEFERNRTSERTREIMAQRRRQGKPTNGQHPYGFRGAGRPGRRSWIPDLLQRTMGRAIVEWKDQGFSFYQIYIHLLQKRIKTPRGDDYSDGTIKRYYYGERALQAREAAGLAGPVPSRPRTSTTKEVHP